MQDSNTDNLSEWEYLRKNFAEKPGSHLLSCGISGCGKTMGAITLCKMILKAGTNVCWFDTGKANEISWLTELGFPITVFYPKKYHCNIEITGSKAPIEYIPLEEPEFLFRSLKPGLNIASLRPFFSNTIPYIRYTSRAWHALINDAHRRKIKAIPLAVFMDEAQTMFPTHRLFEGGNYQQTLIARMSMAIYTLRAERISMVCFTQSYRNIAAPIRNQFNFFVVNRHPDPEPREFIGGLMKRYEPMLAKLDPGTSIIIRPDGTFRNRIYFPMPQEPTGVRIEYKGMIRTRKEKELDIIGDDEGDEIQCTA